VFHLGVVVDVAGRLDPRAEIANIPEAIPVRVCLIGVFVGGAIVALIAEAIPSIRIGLVGAIVVWTVVASVSDPVAIRIFLIRVANRLAIIHQIQEPVSVLILIDPRNLRSQESSIVVDRSVHIQQPVVAVVTPPAGDANDVIKTRGCVPVNKWSSRVSRDSRGVSLTEKRGMFPEWGSDDPCIPAGAFKPIPARIHYEFHMVERTEPPTLGSCSAWISVVVLEIESTATDRGGLPTIGSSPEETGASHTRVIKDRTIGHDSCNIIPEKQGHRSRNTRWNRKVERHDPNVERCLLK
jgi:hypothetical protein